MFGTNNRKTAYSKTDEAAQSRDDRMARLKFELREHIRFLSDYELLSADWLRMAESLHQIANVAFMETHLPATDENPLTQQGKKGTGTLWDQERDELAVRIMLEEGKLNLALRVLRKYKTAQRDSKKFEDQVKATAKKFNSDPAAVAERCRVFEQSVGILLKFALSHIEALQILALPELLAHSKEVLTAALASDKKEVGVESEKLQETLVLYYLASLTSKMEEMDEDAVMDGIENEGIIPLAMQHLAKHYQWYRIDALSAASRFLSSAFASEAFTTDISKFIPNVEIQKIGCQLKGFFIGELVSVCGLKKKDVQALLDQIAKWERVHGVAPVVPLKSKPGTKPADSKDAKDEKKQAVPATPAGSSPTAPANGASPAGAAGAATPATPASAPATTAKK